MKRIHVVGAVIVNGEGLVLCAQRSSVMSHPGLWEFPGGKIEAGEEPRAALKREIREELGCEIETGGWVAEGLHINGGVGVHLNTYVAYISDGVPEAREHASLRWLPVERFSTLSWSPADDSTVAILQRHPAMLLPMVRRARIEERAQQMEPSPKGA